MKGFMISAPSSGTGKTTVTLGILAALAENKYSVAPFKCGPDYIDTQFHAMASGKDSVNLDTFFSNADEIKCLFNHYRSDSKVAIVEGAMGFYDGYDYEKGSAYEIARILNLPVVLVINAKSTAYSIGAVIKGFATFKAGIKIVGVIFNNVGSDRHYKILCQAAKDAGVECLGYLPRCTDISMPSRHLGLAIGETARMIEYITKSKELVKEYVNLDEILKICDIPNIYNSDIYRWNRSSHQISIKKDIKIAVAKDAAFNFTYKQWIDELAKNADLKFFSPLHDEKLPEADILYFPGGYPELYASQLSNNSKIKNEIYTFAKNGGKIFGECGGFMYLSTAILAEEEKYTMVRIFPFEMTMENARLRLGYRTIRYGDKIFKGHEFHYSSLKNDNDMHTIASQFNASGEKVTTGLYRKWNVIAGYTHINFSYKEFLALWE